METNEIPPVGRNDSSLGLKEGESIGGGAANAFSPSLSYKPVISSEARNLKQTLQSVKFYSGKERNND